MTQKQVSYSKIVALLRKQINEVRTNPITLSGYLNSKKARFDPLDPLLFYPLKKTKQLCITTKQGFKEIIAVEELDKFLLKQSACQKLKWSYELHLIAHKKAARLAKSEEFVQPRDVVEEVMEMVDQNKSSANSRLSFWGDKSNLETLETLQNAEKEGVQCVLDSQYYLVYYGVIDPKELVSKILIDDGFPKREHRRALLNKRMNHIGIGIHEHPSQYFVVVIILANHVKQVQKQNIEEDSSCDCQVI